MADCIENDFECIVNRKSLNVSSSQLITGQIAVRIGGAWFPEENWNDFPVRIIGDWISKVRTLRSTTSKS